MLLTIKLDISNCMCVTQVKHIFGIEKLHQNTYKKFIQTHIQTSI